MTLQLRATGFIRKNPIIALPYYIFLLEFSNYSFQIIVPCACKDELHNVEVIQVPGVDETGGPTYGDATTKIKNFSGKTKVKDEPLNLWLGYQSTEKNDGDGITIDQLFEKEGIILKKRLKLDKNSVTGIPPTRQLD